MGHILSHPVQSKNLQRFGDAKFRAGVAEMQGFRTNMEDAHQVTLSLPSHPNITYIGMFDGHNGQAAADFLAQSLGQRINELSDPTDHAQLAGAIEKADLEFMSDHNIRVHGATCCVALITSPEQGVDAPRKLTVANVGDSRCLVIGADGTVKFSTIDHKPDTESEARRIRAAGGSVSFGRVDGDLAMSRSIGDYAYKNVPHLTPLEQKVIPSPDCSDIELSPSDLVLVCCDGLVEKLSNQQVANYVHEQYQTQKANNDIDPAMIMAGLLDHSLVKGSKDNMSSALVIQVDGTSYGRADEYRVGPFSEWASDRGFVEAFMTDANKHGYTNEQAMAMVQSQKDGNSTLTQKKEAILIGSS